MTRDDIIKLAQKAGLDPDLWNYTDAFERFAALVAAAEREACARLVEEEYVRQFEEHRHQNLVAAIRARGQE
jgi:hypothetical protein